VDKKKYSNDISLLDFASVNSEITDFNPEISKYTKTHFPLPKGGQYHLFLIMRSMKKHVFKPFLMIFPPFPPFHPYLYDKRQIKLNGKRPFSFSLEI
jgi:hypothetical protein